MAWTEDEERLLLRLVGARAAGDAVARLARGLGRRRAEVCRHRRALRRALRRDAGLAGVPVPWRAVAAATGRTFDDAGRWAR